MGILKKIYKKIKKPVDWIEIPLPKSSKKEKPKEETEEARKEEE